MVVSWMDPVECAAPGQERFTRCKTLGEDYTEEAIARRIKGLAVDRGPKRKQTKGITLRIDLENNIKAQQSAGYAWWAKLHIKDISTYKKLRPLALGLRQAKNKAAFRREHESRVQETG